MAPFPCPVCAGTGSEVDDHGQEFDCEACDGTGRVSEDEDDEEADQDEMDTHLLIPSADGL